MFQSYCGYLKGRMTPKNFVIWVNSCCPLKGRHNALLSCLPLSQLPIGWGKPTTRLKGLRTGRFSISKKDSLQAYHKVMVGSEVFSSTPHKILLATSYCIHYYFVELTPQVLDAARDLLASADSTVTVMLLSPKLLSPWLEAPGVFCPSLRFSMFLRWSSMSSHSWRWASLIRSLGYHVFRCCSIASCYKRGLFSILPTLKPNS